MRKGTAGDAMRNPELLAVCDALQAKAVAERTLDIYGGELRRLDVWLDGAPLTDELLALYLGTLHIEGRAASTIGTVVAAAKFHAKNEGLPCPVGAQATKTARGIRRDAAAKNGQRQADAVGWEQAERMARLAECRGEASGLRDAVMIALGSDAMLRVSEVAALNVEDVSFGGDGHAEVTVRRSKTDQEGAGRVLYCGPPTADRLKRWIDVAGIAHGALFRPVLKNGAVQESRLSTRSLQNIVKHWAADAGVPGRITWHSLRIGSAQELVARGASLVELQRVGRWQSPTMPARYVRGQLAAEGAMARLRYGRWGHRQQGTKPRWKDERKKVQKTLA